MLRRLGIPRKNPAVVLQIFWIAWKPQWGALAINPVVTIGLGHLLGASRGSLGALTARRGLEVRRLVALRALFDPLLGVKKRGTEHGN